jgi:hypothetical protein
MYSFFDRQEGDFKLVIRSIAAVKAEARYRDDPEGRINRGRRREGTLSWIDEAKLVGLDLWCMC